MKEKQLGSWFRAVSRWIPFAALTAVLPACTVGPAYQSPTRSIAGIPTNWHAQTSTSERRADLQQWWLQFDDPLLSELILSSHDNNPTLEQADARVRQTRAAFDSSSAAFLPSISLKGSSTRSNGTGVASTQGGDAAQTLVAGTLSSSLDLDLFGGTRRSVEGTAARVAASQQDAYESRVVLTANVADAYVARRQCEALLLLNEIDLSSRLATQNLTAKKIVAGFSAAADALRSEALVAEGRSLLRNQKGLCARYINQLVALTGIEPAALEMRLQPGMAIIPAPATTSIAPIPAAVLSQRPDIASLERKLAAASADIGVAEANRLPQLGLAGLIGINSLRIADSVIRFDTWSFYPSLSLPVFDGGRSAAQVSSARARYDEMLAMYRQTLRLAVKEVEDALVRVDTVIQREKAAELAALRYQQYFDMKTVQYRVGATNLLDLEDARRIAVASKQSLAAVHLERAQSWIALFKSVGGGWQNKSSPVVESISSGK